MLNIIRSVCVIVVYKEIVPMNQLRERTQGSYEDVVGGIPDLALDSILIVLMDLDDHHLFTLGGCDDQNCKKKYTQNF